MTTNKMTSRKNVRRKSNREGSMLVMIAITMIIFIIGAVFTIDVAYMHMVRAELRTSTDAAARAGAETIARTQDPEQAIEAALEIARRNSVSGDGLELTRDDIQLGNLVENPGGRFVFEEGLVPPLTSMRIVGRRDNGSAQGPVPLFFAKVLGVTDFQPVQVATASASVRDVALILDRSGSMGSRLGGGTRLTALQDAVRVFLDEVEASSPSTIISLTTYSTGATRDIALTDNFVPIRNDVNSLRASGLTNIRQALQFGSDSLETDSERRTFAAKTIILMTDGNFNRGGTPIPSARLAAGRDQTIHTITFSSGANQAIMRQVADIGNGLHIHADDAGDLTEAFREIARTLSVFLAE